MGYSTLAGGRPGATGCSASREIPAGEHYLRVNPRSTGLNPTLVNEWYAGDDSSPNVDNAIPITVLAGETLSGLKFSIRSLVERSQVLWRMQKEIRLRA